MQDSQITITVTAIDGATKVFEGVGDAAVKQASRAAAAWQKANDISNVSIESTGGMADAANKAAKAQDNLASSTRRSYFAQTALTTILSAGINKAFLTMVDVTGQAIQRVDLISNFPKTMESLGISANDASASLSKLSDYVSSVGGNLQDATTTVTRFTEVTKNVKAATAEFVAVNNALIAGGASTQVQANALEQLIQAYSRGVPQLIEWKSLMVAMPAQLDEVAKAMNLPNAQILGNQLTTGKISMQDFINELTKLGTGTGIIAQQANAHLSGIQFGFNQFKNALVTGMTEIIQAIGRQNITDFFSLLTGTVKQLAVWAVDLIGILFSLFNAVSKVFGGPQLKLASDSTAGIADNLGGAADNAGDLANNLNAANKAASAGLATFDKMNVLTLPSGSGGSPGAGGAGGLSPSDASALNGIFTDLAAKMQPVTEAAKVLAGILASIAGIKFAQGLLNQFNGLVKTIKDFGDNIASAKTGIGKMVDSFKSGISDMQKSYEKSFLAGTDHGSKIKTAGADLANGFIAGISGALAGASRFIFAPIIGAASAAVGLIAEIFIGLAVVLGIPIEAVVGLFVAAVALIIGAIWLIVTNWNTIVSAIETALSGMGTFFVTIFNTVVGAIATVWNTLFSIFAAPIKFIADFIGQILLLALALVTIFIQGVVELFVGLVTGIYTVLSAVAGWIFDNVISPVLGFFTDLWNGIVSIFTVSVNFIFVNILAPIAGWINANVIQPVLGFFSSLWNTVSGFISAFFSRAIQILSPFGSWVYNNIISPIAGFFSGLWNGIQTGLQNMINGLGNLFGNLANLVKSPINAMIDVFNDLFSKLDGVKVPSWVPKFGGDSVHFPKIPHLAQGGIVDQPTLSVVGDAGKEAIMPLENNTGWIDQLASKINAANGGGNGQPINLTVQIGEDKVANKIINLINEKTQMSGRNTILV